MINADTLLTLAEVAAGPIGFAAVASVFLARSEIHKLDLIRFHMIVLIGLQVVFGSFVPFWVVDLSGTSEYLWEISTITIAVMSLPVLIFLLVHYKMIFFGINRKFGGTWMAFTSVGSFLIIGMSLISWPISPRQSLYEILLSLGLLAMAGSFIDLIVNRTEQDA